MKFTPRAKKFLKRKQNDQNAENEQDEDQQQNDLRRMESTSSYMQQRRNIYVNMKLPSSEYDYKGHQIHHNYASNRVRTAKYTPLSFVPKNLFEQFRNVANLYFLLMVILQCFPLFGVTEPAVSALPLIAILIITAIKDAVEDWKRNQSDDKVNNSLVLKLTNWHNVNVPEIHKGTWFFLHVIAGFFSVLSGTENKYAHSYRLAIAPSSSLSSSSASLSINDQPNIKSSEDRLPLTEVEHSEYPPPPPEPQQPPQPPAKTLMTTVRKRSDTIRSGVSGIFSRSNNNHTATNLELQKKPYRPGSIPHSVLYRISTRDSSAVPTPSRINEEQEPEQEGRPSSSLRPMSSHSNQPVKCADAFPGDPPSATCQVKWDNIKWKELNVGDYVLLKNDQDIPADVVILSTSETDNVCYVETQNLDGETNLKQRQGLPGTSGLRTEHDCERARFYIESEPPHVNIYQYNAVLRWQIDANETDTVRSGVSHEKADAVTYNNILLRGCILRNTKWAIGIVVYTGNDTKIMLNTGRTPSKRSKIAKATNPHVSFFFFFFFFGYLLIFLISFILGNCQFLSFGCYLYC
jgi:phospholipid-translocating ATPase